MAACGKSGIALPGSSAGLTAVAGSSSALHTAAAARVGGGTLAGVSVGAAVGTFTGEGSTAELGVTPGLDRDATTGEACVRGEGDRGAPLGGGVDLTGEATAVGDGVGTGS